MITATPSSGLSDNFSGASLAYSVAFTVSPAFCQLTVECDAVLPANSNINCLPTADGAVTYAFTLADFAHATTPIAPGAYTIGYKVYTGPVADQDGLQETYVLDLELIDPCLSAQITAAVPQNFEYTLTDVATAFAFISDFSHTPTECNHSFTAKTITSDANSLSAVLTFDEASQDWQMQQVLDTLVHAGAVQTTYVLSVTYNVYDYDGAIFTSSTVSFDLMIKNPCLDTNFVAITVPDVLNTNYRISDPAKTTAAFPPFTYTTTPGAHQLCGDFTYTVTDSSGNTVPTASGDPITFNPTARTFTLESADASLDGTTKTYTVTASFTSYPGATTASDNFDVDYVDPCLEPDVLATTAQQSLTDKFTNTAQTFTLTPFAVTPARCVITYDCRGVTKDGAATSQLACADLGFDGVLDQSGNDGTFTFTADPARYQDGSLTPGTFTVQICGTVNLALAGDDNKEVCKDVTIVVEDPCNPPVSLTSQGLVNQTYVITHATQTYTHAAFVADPAYCEIEYTYSQTTFTNDNGAQASAISPATATTSTPQQFSIYYDADESPVKPSAQKQVVTVAAQAYSKYDSSHKASTVDLFELTFDTPCNKPSYTTVTATAQTSPGSDKYTGTPIVFTYNPFIVEPSFCVLTVTCESVSTVNGGDGHVSCLDLVNGGVSQSYDGADF